MNKYKLFNQTDQKPLNFKVQKQNHPLLIKTAETAKYSDMRNFWELKAYLNLGLRGLI